MERRRAGARAICGKGFIVELGARGYGRLPYGTGWGEVAGVQEPGGPDDEGVPSRKIGLIESGVIGEPVFDLQTAGQAGRTSTGSAQRGLASTPRPGISVVDIAAGDTPYARMISEMKDGLIVEGLLGAGQGNELGQTLVAHD